MAAPGKAAHVPLAEFNRSKTGSQSWWETNLSPELRAEITAARKGTNPPGAALVAKWLHTLGITDATPGKVHSFLETLR
jgi:hypothetical protein